ncbi:uncharacterized protein LOC131316175 [Rhododendron vialii]|uniref:uncharacterized protein LOC131316175 n=1 Tax=Rhododendron vialii TaxID=182163 RepID=UPI00265DF6EE|nr:uncharacterized protein LOC131316175 [Rhododendron vialii]
MKRGQKRSRTGKGTKAPIESTNTNPYLLFLDDYIKKDRKAKTSPRFFVSKHSKVAAEAWNNMYDAEKAPFMDVANQTKTRIKKNVPNKKRTIALSVFWTRCSPKKLVKQNASLTKDQKIDVQTLGFNSMLTLQCKLLNREFIS